MNFNKVRLNWIVKTIYSYIFSSEFACPLYLKYSIISIYQSSSGDANFSVNVFLCFFQWYIATVNEHKYISQHPRSENLVSFSRLHKYLIKEDTECLENQPWTVWRPNVPAVIFLKHVRRFPVCTFPFHLLIEAIKISLQASWILGIICFKMDLNLRQCKVPQIYYYDPRFFEVFGTLCSKEALMKTHPR